MDRVKIITFTHKTVDISEIGKFHIEETQLKNRLCSLKQRCALNELMYISTCNRIVFLMSSEQPTNQAFLTHFFNAFNPAWTEEEILWAIEHASIYESEAALLHLFNVASSLDSMVVGEREIITQVRNAYELCHSYGITGDAIRIFIKKTVETAKKVYTETNIAKNPVSVVSLAYRSLKNLNVKLDARFLFIGTGVTNSSMAKYLKKHGFKNFVVFNRTLKHAQKLAEELKGNAFSLSELNNYSKGFDVIVTCTSSVEPIINPELYKKLLNGDTAKKVIIDLAVPNDVDAEVLKHNHIEYIAVSGLEKIAKENLKQREDELLSCMKIINHSIDEFKELFNMRKVELAMSEVPKKVKEIRELALTEIFAKEVEALDSASKETLDKILAYVEKKYISLPMKMAKEILVEKVTTKPVTHDS